MPTPVPDAPVPGRAAPECRRMCVRLCRCLCVRLSGLDALGATALHGAPCACLACVHDRRNAQVTAAPDYRILDGEIALDAADGEAAGVELDEALSSRRPNAGPAAHATHASRASRLRFASRSRLVSRVECMRRVLLTLHVFKCPCQQRQADNSAVGSPRCLFYMY